LILVNYCDSIVLLLVYSFVVSLVCL